MHVYRAWDEEAGEQVPKAEEEGHDNGGNLEAGGQGDNHHAVH